MLVSAQNRKNMLSAERSNPEIIRGNRLSNPPELNSHSCVVMCRSLIDVQHPAVRD